MDRAFIAMAAAALLINLAIWGGIAWAVYELVTWLTAN